MYLFLNDGRQIQVLAGVVIAQLGHPFDAVDEAYGGRQTARVAAAVADRGGSRCRRRRRRGRRRRRPGRRRSSFGGRVGRRRRRRPASELGRSTRNTSHETIKHIFFYYYNSSIHPNVFVLIQLLIAMICEF